MTKFEKRFLKSLNEQAEEERAAFEAELEDNTEAGDFDVDVEDPLPVLTERKVLSTPLLLFSIVNKSL